MYFFYHLAVGIVLGLLLADLFHDGRWLLPCAIGSILPDLIDKPVGHLLLQAYFGYGRILFHTLLVFAIILAAGLVLWKYRRSPVILALVAGIFLHQVLDSMWDEPASWFFPFLGPPPLWRTYPPGYFFILVRENLLSPSEWFMAGLLIAGFILWLKKDRVHAIAEEHGRGLGLALKTGGILFGLLSIIILSFGIVRKLHSHAGRFPLSGPLVYSLSCALVALLLWRWGSGLGNGPGGPGKDPSGPPS